MTVAAARLAAALLVTIVAALLTNCHSKNTTGTSPDSLAPPIGIAFSNPGEEMTFFDLDDCEVTGTQVLSSWAVSCAQINFQGDRMVVIDDNHARIGVFSLPDLSEATSVALGGVPMDLQLTTSGSLAYVVTQNSVLWQYAISAHNLDTLDTGVAPRRLALRPPNGLQLWVACQGSYAVFVYDLSVFQPLDTLEFVTEPTAVAFRPDGLFAYVARRGSPGEVEIVDAASRTVVGFMDAGSGPFDLAMSDNGQILAASDSARGRVRIWNLTNSQQWDINVGSSPGRIRYAANEQAFYVCGRQQGHVYRISATGEAPVLTDTVRTAPIVREVLLWESNL